MAYATRPAEDWVAHLPPRFLAAPSADQTKVSPMIHLTVAGMAWPGREILVGITALEPAMIRKEGPTLVRQVVA